MEGTYDFYELNIMMVLVSFLGFLTENCWNGASSVGNCGLYRLFFDYVPQS